MAVGQLPVQVLEFARYLNGLVDRLDRGGGWCGVFWQRDPDGMQACLEGREVPPWDVVEALLQDVFGQYGERAAAQETVRARALHAASLTAYDVRPGGRDALGDRLDVMLREQRYAAERQAELSGRLPSAASQGEAEAIRADLAWAQDDHQRATARCAELLHRMDNVDRHAHRARERSAPHPPAAATGDGMWRPGPENRPDVSGGHRPGRHPSEGGRPDGNLFAGDPSGPGTGHAPGHTPGRAPGRDARSLPADQAPGPDARPFDADRAPGPDPRSFATDHPSGREVHPTGASVGTPQDDRHDHGRVAAAGPARDTATPGGDPHPGKRAKRRRRGSARFAGMVEPDVAPVAVPETGPVLPAPTVRGASTPRGARFAGAAEEPARSHAATGPELPDEDARRLIGESVAALTRLRGEGRSGEAHVLLVEAAYWPPARFPLLAAELHRAGLDADWATLLWEAASLPADRLVAAADALATAGRVADGRQMLRQGVTRPAPEIAAAVLGLTDEGRGREVGALLDAYVRVRTPEEAARSAETDPERLVPLLLRAAQGVSDECGWDLLHALRVAGFAA
ncbi:hypothetical protein [Streptomyces sp. NPDC001914]|uniref:hypothetical protein n=1 Tax=Streptomyces sp. NPDC001914 TaxID=3364623 RepID=UPI0036A2B409